MDDIGWTLSETVLKIPGASPKASAGTGGKARRGAGAGAVMASIALAVSACTGSFSGPEPSADPTSGSVSPGAATSSTLAEPNATGAEPEFSPYGQPVISGKGMGKGSFELPVPLKAGQRVAVTASCIGSGMVHISSDAGTVDSAASCTNPGGFLAEIGVKDPGADQKISMDAGPGNQFWLKVFVMDAPSMAPVEAGAAASPETVEWAKSAIKPEGIEIARFVDTGSGTIAKVIQVQPGIYKWTVACRGGGHLQLTFPGDDDKPAQGMACTDGGVASKVVDVQAASTVKMTAELSQRGDLMSVLTRQP
ncbi:hypothetical protein IV500_02955 [Paeniglutamicibacter antarcticus]|uniref:Uncharacterized protein n=1 Tax=Arthrobacter terrae TaxID=2935737 RepID=A0A931G6J9_9MICC|nr:hypothetical protein [Arthrobacter terrae]MBG0738389.1 hypothetical protein [Arthrobacter terrae]